MQSNVHFQLVSQALEWLSKNQGDQPDLDALAQALGVSPYHLQRTFQAWAGVTPKQFLKSLTRMEALARLREGRSVLDAALESGLSGPGRLHDLLVTTEALTPGEVRRGGAGVTIHYGFGESPFGPVLVSWTTRGINYLAFCQSVGKDQALNQLHNQWPRAVFVHEPEDALAWIDKIFKGSHGTALRLWLKGTPFQLKVWEALVAIPEGANATYADIAELIGQPGASRAVGSAIGKNPIAWVIPCHRVIRKLGDLGGYRWGQVTKSAMIGFEASRTNPNLPPSTERRHPANAGARPDNS
jgi:AraC family transcriptional regulator of adaptative response/methylated-DNA-[protein]-cysteine methyltransferase